MSRKSFTLIELVVVIVVVGIIAAVLAPLISTALDSWFFTETERDLVFSARLAMNRMVREIRLVRDTGSITTFTSTEFAFQDINNISISFQQAGNSLLRNSDELTNKLQDPDGLTFTYLDSEMSDDDVQQGDIRMVRILLILESGSNSITLQSLAKFRNVS